MRTVKAYAAPAPDAPLRPVTISRRDPGPKDVLIEIAYCGICHSDIHVVRGDWGSASYPLVVGHEIVGTVAAVGSEVTTHALGDRVGVGCMVNACRECENCLAGEEQYCLNGAVDTYGGIDVDGSITQGGYSTHIVVNEDFVVRIPETIAFASAAPLLCAGITTYSPLRHWGAGPGKDVAVVGMGGLGHMAVKFAHALGADVTVLSRTLSKKEDALRFGADHYCATQDSRALAGLKNRFGLIINTVSSQTDIARELSLLRRDGTMVNVGAPAEPLSFRVFALFDNRRSLAGSTIGGIRETQEMLDFCAAHGIAPETELIAASAINEAWARVVRSDVRYRFVIDASTFA